ncbi:MAG: DUF1553 domain-containing protein [Planctomycetota bacterium]
MRRPPSPTHVNSVHTMPSFLLMDASPSRRGDGRLGWLMTLVSALGVFVWASIDRVFSADDSPDILTDEIAFFESRIRPVLIESCYECHSAEADDVGGSLWLDSADAMRTGGDSGPAVMPGDLDASVLISAIRYESSEMPPSGRLPESVIRDFETWVRRGAVDPRTAALKPRRDEPMDVDWEAARRFWAFRPLGSNAIASPRPHPDQHPNWIDQRLAVAMDSVGIEPNGMAEPAVQLRRLCYDLTGLPPTDTLLDAWIADPTDRHWRRIVDRLLSAPGYGEHWARHWMDVARYADSNGGDFNATFHDAWRYRDYLIDRYQSDAPIDQMIREQVAGDRMTSSDDVERTHQIVATTFLMLGSKMLSERNKPKLTMDVVDEQIDTVGRAFMGMTLGCARCHDHKFDPIPTEDYYALAGIFRSSQSLQGESQQYVSTWQRTPLPCPDDQLAAIANHQRELDHATEQLKQAEESLEAWAKANDSKPGIWVDDQDATLEGPWVESTYTKGFSGSHYLHDKNANKGQCQIHFEASLPAPGRYQLRFWYAAAGSRSSAVPLNIAWGEQTKTLTVNQQVRPRDGDFTLTTIEIAEPTSVSVSVSNRGTVGYVIVDAVQWLMVDDEGTVITDEASDEAEQGRRDQEQTALQAEVDRWNARRKQLIADAPPPRDQAMAIQEATSDTIADCRVHIRGEVNNLGDIVPRGFLRICGGDSVSIQEGSGRLQLATWLTDPDHPLTARVYVNRVWMHLMGEGIVRTVDNFGTRGDRPSHPDLLDELATRFIRGGWRQKRLIHDIVTSNAYRRCSQTTSDGERLDPENRLRWRGQRRRLPAEAIRDTMLLAAGRLQREPVIDPMRHYGVLISKNNAGSSAESPIGLEDPRRTLYLPIIRNHVPAFLVNLDFVNPDLLTGQRSLTNVPAQALTLINSPESKRWAAATARRLLESSVAPRDRAAWLIKHLWHRPVTDDDNRWLPPDLMTGHAEPSTWTRWVAAMMASTEFRFLD